MPPELEQTQAEAARLTGDPHPLIERIGSAGAWAGLPAGYADAAPAVSDPASFRAFLGWYRAHLLAPVELPAIVQAHRHASRYEVRELIALDRALCRDERLAGFAAASQAVGRSQLRRLLPLRDQRLVRRYYRAVATGDARAWHIVVYGVVLSLYALPLRQGLLAYARQTLGGFVQSARSGVGLPAEAGDSLFEEVCRDLPALVEQALTDWTGPRQLVE